MKTQKTGCLHPRKNQLSTVRSFKNEYEYLFSKKVRTNYEITEKIRVPNQLKQQVLKLTYTELIKIGTYLLGVILTTGLGIYFGLTIGSWVYTWIYTLPIIFIGIVMSYLGLELFFKTISSLSLDGSLSMYGIEGKVVDAMIRYEKDYRNVEKKYDTDMYRSILYLIYQKDEELYACEYEIKDGISEEVIRERGVNLGLNKANEYIGKTLYCFSINGKEETMSLKQLVA